MSTNRSDAASRFAAKLSRADPVQGPARNHTEALVAEIESLSEALVACDKRLVDLGASIMKEERARH